MVIIMVRILNQRFTPIILPILIPTPILTILILIITFIRPSLICSNL